MTGIASFGAYIPMTRLAVGRGEKAVANHDEDAITMAVASGIDCLRGLDRAAVDGVLFASTTHPYREKLGAALIARALDLRRDVFTADYGGSLRAGTSALRGALDAVRAGTLRSVLVVVSDNRVATPGSPLDQKIGDAAAALLVSDDAAIATLEATHAVADEILDVWRGEHDEELRMWEERFVVKHGYRDNIVEAVTALSNKLGRRPQEFDRAVLFGFDAREHADVVRILGLERARVEEPLFGKVGNAGAAFVPLLIASALEHARPGERILVGSYGDGAEAMALSTTDRISERSGRRGVAGHLARRRVGDAAVYQRAREAMRSAPPSGISATKHFRERDEDISFKARACRRCNTLHFPAQRVCIRCFQRDDFEPVRLSDRSGKLLSHTVDYFHPAPERPTLAGIVEIEGGCRVYLQVTDATADALRLDLPVELTFRRIHRAGGMPNYYWKCTPRSAS